MIWIPVSKRLSTGNIWPVFSHKMSHYRKLSRLYFNGRYIHTNRHLFNKPITGYETADNALQSVTGGRIYKWLDAYEDFVGLTEVKNAQALVTQAEATYREIQENRRKTQQQLTAVHSKIKALAMEIEKTKRGTDAYLELVVKENVIVKEEKDVQEQLTVLEDDEKQSFTLLSSALRESHEKERARAERMKYWGIMGSIIGAAIGIVGTTINNYLRMKELRRIVTASTESNKDSRELSNQLCISVKEQCQQIQETLKEIKSSTGTITPATLPAAGHARKDNISDAKLNEVLQALKQQEKTIRKDIEKLSNVLVAKTGQASLDQKTSSDEPSVDTDIQERELSISTQRIVGAIAGTCGTIALGAFLWQVFGGS